MGGWGLEGWLETLSKTRACLADPWAYHPSVWVRHLWFSARGGSFLCQSISEGSQAWLGKGTPSWAQTAPDGKQPWTARSAQLWALGGVGLCDGWDIEGSGGDLITAALLWQYSAPLPPFARNSRMTK